MSAWVIWVIVAGGLIAAETLSLTLVLGMAAAGALAAAAAAGLGAGLVLQVVVFTLVTAATLLVVRPVAKRHLHTPAAQRTGIAALVARPPRPCNAWTARGVRSSWRVRCGRPVRGMVSR